MMNKRQRLTLTAVFVGLALYGFPVFGESENLITNGDFETDGIGGIAAGWQDNSGWSRLAVSYEQTFDNLRGNKVQLITCTQYFSGMTQFMQPTFGIKSGTAYRVSLLLRGSVGSPVKVSIRERASPYRQYISSSFKIDRDWKLFSFVGISKADDNAALFMVRFPGNGTLAVDNVIVEELVGNGQCNATIKKENLVSNGSFELGIERWSILYKNILGNDHPLQVFNPPEPYIDEDANVVGQRSLRVTVSQGTLCRITSPYFPVIPDCNYTLSLWLKSDRPLAAEFGLAAGHLGEAHNISSNVLTVGTWRRYTVAGRTKYVPDESYYVVLKLQGEGQVWIDGVQLEAGGPKEFTQSKDVEVSVHFETPIYELNQNITGSIRLCAPVRMVPRLTVYSTDFYGTRNVLLSESIVAEGCIDLRMEHPSNKTGYFRIAAEVTEGEKVIDCSEKAIGVIPAKLTTRPSPSIGNHIYFSYNSLQLARTLGISWLRLHPPYFTKWFAVEKNKNEFEFMDAPIMQAKQLGYSILGSLDTTPRWASVAPAGIVSAGASGYRSYPAKDLEDWKNYVRRVVSRYRGVIDCWEVWNEPDSDFLNVPDGGGSKAKEYVNLLRAAYEAAKAVNPDVKIVGGVATEHPITAWTEKIFQEGALDYLDILSYHRYGDGRSGDELEPPTGALVAEVGALMEKYGVKKTIPIWESESGIRYTDTAFKSIKQVFPEYAFPAEESAVYFVRNLVHLIASGVERWFYYGMFTNHSIDNQLCTGYFEWDGSPRPLAVACAVWAYVMQDAQFEKDYLLDNSVYVAEFRRNEQKIKVIWSRINDGVLSFKTPYNDTTVAYDLMGNEVAVTRTPECMEIAVTRRPIYVVQVDKSCIQTPVNLRIGENK